MRSTALSLALAIGALTAACELDKSPGRGEQAIESDGGMPDAAADAGDGGDAASSDAGDAGRDAAAPPDDDAGPSPCGAGCPSATPICLAARGACVECSADKHCADPERPACDPTGNACVRCTADDDCGGDAPRCSPDTKLCVQCAGDGDCGGETPRCDPASARCVGCLASDDCDDAAPVCDPQASACVQCLSSADCADPGAPQCEDQQCVPCTSDAACADRPDATLCDLTPGASTAGSCVQCTVADETACAGNVCDPGARTCTDRPLASKQTCAPCIADSECVDGHRCIAMEFMGAARPSSYCMKRLQTGCARPYASEPIRIESRSGAPAEDYCGIDQQTTTCEAIAGLLIDAECQDGSDAACTHPGSLCRTVNGLANRCTYACTLAAQCPPGVSCGSGYCGGP